MDHHRCNIYYIPETQAYRISGSTELFPQHCQLPDMLPHQHLRALTNELSKLAPPANATPKGQRLLGLLQSCIHHILHLPPAESEQRVDETIDKNEAEQRVINDTPIITIPCITKAPGIIQSCKPTVKRTL
jgi:hypothetical protein